MSPAEHAALTRLGWNDTLAASIHGAPPQAVPVRVIEPVSYTHLTLPTILRV